VNTFAVQFAPNVLLTSRQCANCTEVKRNLISTVLILQIYDTAQPLVPTVRVNMEPVHISFAKQVNDCAVYEQAGSAGLSPWFDPVRGHGDEDVIPVHTGRKNHWLPTTPGVQKLAAKCLLKLTGLELLLVRRALCTFAPHFPPNDFILSTATSFSQERLAAWSLAAAS
jgi:hypothetical protein